MMLYFCYGGTVCEEELAANAKAIIEAADRFGIVNLKLQAEAVLVEQTEITVDNMLDNLLYANSKNLALFQEMIMDFVAENGDKIVGKVSFDDVPGNLISDILTAFAQGKKSAGEVIMSKDDLKFMRVDDLRKRLHEKGLCIDGSRETMIALLKENSGSNETGAEETDTKAPLLSNESVRNWTKVARALRLALNRRSPAGLPGGAASGQSADGARAVTLAARHGRHSDHGNRRGGTKPGDETR
ncbi:hypothetical protein THAOC_14781, partial [Thalassiosira oceanica]